VYKKGDHSMTVYLDFNPIKFLRMEYEKMQLEDIELEAKKQIWEERIKYLRRLFHSSKTDSKLANFDSQ
jgi:hypothetical protein